ncbi:MAG: ABC transporter permease [Candidatus Limnocylindria bacterium]
MNARRTLAISRRIADLFRRDHRTLALVFVAPIVIMALLGWVIRDQDAPATRLAAVTPAGPAGDIGRQRLQEAAAAAGIDFRDDITNEEAARQALRDAQIDIALVVTLDGEQPGIKVITPGINPPADSGRIGELRQLVATALGQTGPPIEQESIYGAGDGDFFNAFAPALVGFVVFFLVFILTGISFLRERVGGTLERLLATPVRRVEIVVGYSVGFGVFATLQVALVLAFLLGSLQIDAVGPLPEVNLGLGVPIAGSPILAFVITLLLALCAVNLGIFLSTFARTEFQILQFIPLVIVPQTLLAGLLWPIDSLPGVLEPIARVMPMTYGIDGLREVLVKGSGLDSAAVQLDVAVLAGIALLLAVLATLTIRREVA